MRELAPQRLVAAALAITAGAVVATTSALIISAGTAHAGGMLPALSGVGQGLPSPFGLQGVGALDKY